MQKWIVPLILILVLAPHARAATFFAGPSDTGAGDCSSASNRCDLQQALNNSLGAGDIVSVAADTYFDRYDVNNSTGTTASPVHILCESQHDCEFRGDNNTTSADVAFDINVDGVKLEGMDIRDYYVGVEIIGVTGSDEITISKNIIHNMSEHGVHVECFGCAVGAEPKVRILDNVMTRLRYDGEDEKTMIYLNHADDHVVDGNIIWGSGDEGLDQGFEEDGYNIYIHNTASGNLVEGNLLLAAVKEQIRILDFEVTDNTKDNIIRDNILAFAGKGMGVGIGGGLDGSKCENNTIENNIIWGHGMAPAVELKGCDPGGNIINHNTIILTDESRGGIGLVVIDGDPAKETVIKNNLTHAGDAITGDDIHLFHVTNATWADSTHEAASGLNLWWENENEASSTWIANNAQFFDGVGDIGADIHNFATGKPVFVDISKGDITLQTGSPGKGAGEGGSDMGATFNEDLRKDWMEEITSLEVVDQAVSGSSTSVAVSGCPITTCHYMVMIKTSDESTDNVNYTFEGVTVQRDHSWFGGFDWANERLSADPYQWMYGAIVAVSDGTLNASWTSSGILSRIRVLRLPTPEEAFGWMMTGGGSPTPPPTPTGLTVNVISDAQIDVSWNTVADSDGIRAYHLERCIGAACSNWQQIASIPGTSWSDLRLTSNTVHRYRVRAEDATHIASDPSSAQQGTTEVAQGPTIQGVRILGSTFK